MSSAMIDLHEGALCDRKGGLWMAVRWVSSVRTYCEKGMNLPEGLGDDRLMKAWTELTTQDISRQ